MSGWLRRKEEGEVFVGNLYRVRERPNFIATSDLKFFNATLSKFTLIKHDLNN